MKKFFTIRNFLLTKGITNKGSSAILSNKFEISRILFYENTNRFFVTGETSPTLSISSVSWYYTIEFNQRKIYIFQNI